MVTSPALLSLFQQHLRLRGNCAQHSRLQILANQIIPRVSISTNSKSSASHHLVQIIFGSNICHTNDLNMVYLNLQNLIIISNEVQNI